MKPPILLIIQFNWPHPFETEHGRNARALHDAVETADWITEVLAGSGGVGAGPASIWAFEMADYAALDTLLHGNDPVAAAYATFFSAMDDVHDIIREKVHFA